MNLLRSLHGSGWLVALTALAACGSGTANQSMDTHDQAPVAESEITAFIAAHDSAWLAKDTTRIAEHLDSNYVYFNSRGVLRDRQYILELVGHPTYRVENMTRTEITPYVHGSIAIVGTRWTATPYYRGVRYDDDQRCVLTLSKHEGSLRLLAEHCTEITGESG